MNYHLTQWAKLESLRDISLLMANGGTTSLKMAQAFIQGITSGNAPVQYALNLTDSKQG